MDTPMEMPRSANDLGARSSETRTMPGGLCPTCSLPTDRPLSSSGVEQFLGRLGISDEMVSKLKTSMQNVDFEEYLNVARDYLKDGSTKATTFAKENPGKVAAGVAVLAVGAGLLIGALNRE